MDLFGYAHNQDPDLSSLPLPELLRPKSLDDMLGQPRILGENTPWRKLIQAGRLPSLILWGPPGCGKTTFARLLIQNLDAEVVSQNAIEMGAKSLRELGEAAVRRRLELRRKTVLFIDEIHRLNKAQQDVLLPFVEKGDFVLVGATTENPSYELNSALLSRCRILVFERLTEADLTALIGRACATRGIRGEDLLAPEALSRLLELADGDGRRLLNMMELILNLWSATVGLGGPGGAGNLKGGEIPSDEAGELAEGAAPAAAFPLSRQGLEEVLDAPILRYDKTRDEHYDTVSAFIKSVRGSNPDAAVYYLARMVRGGEDPVFIARRLVILASEDIGNADPRALNVAVAGLQAVELIGWPEAAISLAQVTTYLASAPKSNRSYMALQSALELVDRTGTKPIPMALRSAKTAAMKSLGYGKGYRYSHDGPKGYLQQEFFPEGLEGTTLYEPTDHGFEKNIRQYLEWLKS